MRPLTLTSHVYSLTQYNNEKLFKSPLIVEQKKRITSRRGCSPPRLLRLLLFPPLYVYRSIRVGFPPNWISIRPVPSFCVLRVCMYLCVRFHETGIKNSSGQYRASLMNGRHPRYLLLIGQYLCMARLSAVCLIVYHQFYSLILIDDELWKVGQQPDVSW